MGEEAAEEAGDGEGAAEAQVVAAAGEACLAAEAAEAQAAAVTAEVDPGLARDLHPVEVLEAPINIPHSNTAREEVGPAVAAGLR